MDEEGDLRTYINVLLRHWRVILAATLLAGAAAFAVSFLSPPKYQSSAVLLVTGPLYQFRFSSEIQNLSANSAALALTAGKAASDLATSDALMQQVLQTEAPQLPENARELSAFRKMLAVKIGSDPSIIHLIVTGRDPQVVAQIANTWADLYVKLANMLYGKSDDQIQFFEGQLAEAKTDLDRADQALIDHETQSDQAILKAQLAAKQAALQDYLGMNESLVLLQQNVKDLQTQLAHRPADAPSNLGDNLAQVMLQVNALSSQARTLPIFLQLPSSASMSAATVGEQSAYLADLAKTIEAKQAEVKKQAEALPVEIKALQGKVQEREAEAAGLKRERDLAESVYTSLAQKARETQISAQDVASGNVRIASEAVAADRPMSRKVLATTAVAIMLGFMMSVAGVFVVRYFQISPSISDGARSGSATLDESHDHRVAAKEARG